MQHIIDTAKRIQAWYRYVAYVAWGYILRLITDPERFENALRQAQAMEAEQMQPKQKELEHVMALLDATEQEAEEVAGAARKVKGLVGEKLQAQAHEIDRRYQALQARKTKLQEDLKFDMSDHNLDDLLQFREAVAMGLNHSTPGERRLWLELLKTRVTVTDGTAIVTCRFGGEAAWFDLFTGYQISASGI